ncbi:hypothetical protein BUALT_Bualt03G0099100 [Buddleja alternifolia]|uniref:galactinol--sucrose galactosyltransferase n=1 Tax=Buddleja alternifolia TaxID=168488 RepID=A0AAV6XSG4_9LAMI|nr:hypothetical protein BUALT_Bualt03G0099100 [Buddleja alternifolia]
MTICVSDGKLNVLGESILSDVHDNIIVTPASGAGVMANGAFIGVESDHTGNRRVFPIGKLRNRRFLSLFRFKIWWMSQMMGTCGQDIPFETQFLMVEGRDDSSHFGEKEEQSALYVLFLPILEGDFRAFLQGHANNELDICLESGDPDVQEFNGNHLVFVAAGCDPFDLITNAIKTVEGHLQTFCHREKKEMPDILNWFGWCTWDAFYTDVNSQGVKQGLHSLEKGGIHPKFLIIDDGWQSVDTDPIKRKDVWDFARHRVSNIKENHKFQKDGKEGERVQDPAMGMRHIVTEIKDQHSIKYVYVWHAMTGYWGGVRPGVAEMEKYEPKIAYPDSSPWVQPNQECVFFNSVDNYGIGLVNPDKIYNFYDDLHSYLASAGIDGVKVDGQSVAEILGAGHGGGVKLTRKYLQALEASVSTNFPDKGIISCMNHGTNCLYSSKQTGVVRASEDFWPKDPASHTTHIASVAYNTIFLGEFMQPDWDMFHSVHEMAEYHGAARALGGCAIYVSDKPGQHDFNLLKKLVLPDGSILRAKLPGRPTRDCLFTDPARDGKSLLKIWNLNDHNGVLGVFNCQGAAWCKIGKKNLIHDEKPCTITGIIRAKDVDYLPRVASDGWNGDAVVYSHRHEGLVYLANNTSLSMTLDSKEYEVFTVVLVKEMSNKVAFAPIGLTKMFNSGGAIKELSYELEKPGTVDMKVHGCGPFGAYSTVKPKTIQVEAKEVKFEYEEASGLITFVLKIPVKEMYLWNVIVEM